MAGGSGSQIPKRTKWNGITKKRCKTVGCKKRVRSYQESGLCNKCVNENNQRKNKK